MPMNEINLWENVEPKTLFARLSDSECLNQMAFVMLLPRGGVVADSISRMCGDLHVDLCGGVNWALGKK